MANIAESVKTVTSGNRLRIYSLGTSIKTKQLKSLTNRTESGCWEWAGTRKCNGGNGYYGVVKYQGKQWYAHRLMWSMHYEREIPAGMEICHHCDNPPCVNPSHLFLGTHFDNIMDATKKGRMASGRHHGMNTHPERRAIGERNGMSKLTSKDILSIRSRYRPRHKVQLLLSEFGISRTHLWRIVNGKLWKHVTPSSS